jgi:hypothetical protein
MQFRCSRFCFGEFALTLCSLGDSARVQGGLDMTIDGTKLIQHIDEMRARLTQTAHTERSLVEELGESLSRLDHEMLQNIRNIATGHEARRGAILNELQALAGSIGMFLPPREPVEPTTISQQNGHSYVPAGGDWRLAARNLSYQEELESHLNGHLNGKGSH